MKIQPAANHFGLPLVKIDLSHIQNDGTMWHKWHGLAHNFPIESIKSGQISQILKSTGHGKYMLMDPGGTRQCHCAYATTREECEKKLIHIIEVI